MIKELGGSFLQKWFFALLLEILMSLAFSFCNDYLMLRWSRYVRRRESAELVTFLVTELLRVPVFEPLRRDLRHVNTFSLAFRVRQPEGLCVVDSLVDELAVDLRISTNSYSITM
jgi:hypothetical protein